MILLITEKPLHVHRLVLHFTTAIYSPLWTPVLADDEAIASK